MAWSFAGGIVLQIFKVAAFLTKGIWPPPVSL